MKKTILCAIHNLQLICAFRLSVSIGWRRSFGKNSFSRSFETNFFWRSFEKKISSRSLSQDSLGKREFFVKSKRFLANNNDTSTQYSKIEYTNHFYSRKQRNLSVTFESVVYKSVVSYLMAKNSYWFPAFLFRQSSFLIM